VAGYREVSRLQFLGPARPARVDSRSASAAGGVSITKVISLRPAPAGASGPRWTPAAGPVVWADEGLFGFWSRPATITSPAGHFPASDPELSGSAAGALEVPSRRGTPRCRTAVFGFVARRSVSRLQIFKRVGRLFKKAPLPSIISRKLTGNRCCDVEGVSAHVCCSF